VKLCIRSISIILFMVLAACGPATPSRPTEIASPTVVATETYTPTETQTPTVTLTPTESKTPTETAIPVPEYYKGIAPSLDKFTLVTEEQEQQIMVDIMAHPELITPTDKKNRIGRRSYNSVIGGVDYGCTSYGETCMIRASISEKNPHGGDDLWKVIWEVLDPDGTHKYIIGYIGSLDIGSDGSAPEQIANQTLTSILKLKNGYNFAITILTIYTHPTSQIPNPYALDITSGAKNQQVLRDLEKSTKTGILPEGLSEVTVYTIVVE